MEFTRVTPGAAGIPPRAILDFVNALEEDRLGVHSFMLMRHGQIAAEAWWKPYAKEKTHMLFSLSKSFTSTAVGFAVGEGKLSLDDKVLSFFEDYALTPCENMKKMTIRNLLTMGTGHSREPRVFDAPDWAYAFLTSYVDREPGSLFVYNTPATYMLSCIVQRVTGEKVIDYLTPRLFEPLGIHDIFWDESPQGVNTGGFGLNIRTEDIMRFASFLLNRGMVDGKQLIDPEWLQMATSRQISNGDPAQKSDWSQGYGFQFWRCQPENVYRGDGAFGQYCVVMPDQDACLAMTSGSGDIGRILAHAWKYLVPAMGEPCADDGLDELNARLSGLGIELPIGNAHAEAEKTVGGRYEFGANPVGLKAISFDFSGETPALSMENGKEGDGEMRPMGFGTWIESGKGSDTVACAYAWQPDGTLIARCVMDKTPFIATLSVRFSGSAIEVKYSQNVGTDGGEMRLIGLMAE